MAVHEDPKLKALPPKLQLCKSSSFAPQVPAPAQKLGRQQVFMISLVYTSQQSCVALPLEKEEEGPPESQNNPQLQVLNRTSPYTPVSRVPKSSLFREGPQVTGGEPADCSGSFGWDWHPLVKSFPRRLVGQNNNRRY